MVYEKFFNSFFSFLFFSFLFLNAQDVKSGTCATDELHLKNLKENPDYKRNFENNSLKWQDFAQKNYNKWDNSKSQNKNTNFIPPQVTTLNIAIHDMSSNSSFLPTTGTDIHAYDYIINKLNQIFNGVNLVSPENGNPTFINFCLTSKDKNGNPYTLSTSRTTTPLAGILARTTTAMTALASAANSNLLTPTNKSINIYIVDDIDGVAGFATLPSSHGQFFDGIFIERQFLINNSSLNQNMEVLAHEMGHYLGLFHVFGICDPTLINSLTDVNGYNPCSCDNNNCLFNGDMICDTAPSMLLQPANYTCNINTCSTDAIPYPNSGSNVNPITSNVNDSKNNYMDYGLANCHSQFTVGQITRMNFMIDPIDGPRKSLVGQSACVNCAEMNNCTFIINTNVALPGIRHEIIQIASGTPAITFSPAVTTCATNTINNLIYSWELQFLNTNSVVVPTFTATNFTTASTLVPGNYQLTMTATFGSLCSETATYNFVIYPSPLLNCNLTLPASNSAADWTADNWNRITFTNGWAIVPPIPLSPPYNYVNGSQPQIPTSSNFNSNGFDVVNLVNGALPNGYDTNFTGITLPINSNITSVIRVGEIINSTNTSQGNAYYAKKTITVNSQNCKFKVWYLGATNGVVANIKNPFHLASLNSDAAFGILNQYHYNSPVNTTTTFLNSDLGSDENGNLPNLRTYSNNDLVSKFMNSTVGQFSTIGLPKNTQWQSYILDYSEFALLNPNTEIELTFFAHSNVVVNGLALQKAYAYFGIECLGSGIPRDFNINIPDQVLPCSSPSANQSLVLQIPSPIYTNFDNNLPIDNSIANFVNIQIFRALSPNIYSTNPEPTFSLSTGLYTLTLNATDAPFVDYRIVYKTLNKTITDDFRVFIGFNNNLQDCESGQTGGQIDVNYYNDINNDNNNSNNINIISNDILLCGTDNLPVLKLTHTCITLPHTFQWYRGNELIPGAINEDLQLSITNPNLTMNVLNNYNTNNCHEYTRRTLYTEPYCGNPKSIQSQKFKIYNYQTINFVNISANDHDICFGENYELDVIGSSLSTYSCTIPTSFNLNNNTQNIFSFQMFDPVSLQGIGNVITQTFEGPINWSETLNNMHFVFDNVNPSNPSQPLFLPSNTGNINISLQIIGNYFGCQKNIIIPIQTFNFESSAIGGTIGFTCANNGITNVNAGITSTAGYGWQSSNDNITFTNIIGAPNTNNLSPSFVNTLLGSNPTLFIRRVSFGFGTCAANAFSNVVIITNHPTSVIFNATLLPTTICNGSNTFTLPTTSSNGIIGTWNVATINNISSANYTFTPSAGYCLPPYTYNLTVTNTLVPTFNTIPPICAGQSFTLPTTSLNGVTGTWLPNVNNMVTTTYTFTPTSGGCSSNLINLTVVVNPIATISFNNSNISPSFCTGSTAPILPLVDDNGITGTWSPSVVSNTSSGVYVFTPSQGQCANVYTLNVSIITLPCGFTLNWNSEVSCESVDNPDIKDNNIVDGPCIRVCENSIITYNLNGSLTSVDHTDWNITGGTILNANNSSCQIQWSNASFCAIQGTIYLIDGNTLAISKCIEKVNAPIALFGVMPNLNQTEYTVCENSSVLFENLTTNNGGNENIYYNWDFGDGITSSAFEPIHSYHQSGNYTVTLIASNGCSCSSKYTISIIVEGGNVPISCPSIACENEVTTYSVPQDLLDHCNIDWDIIGGEIVGYDNNNTSIDVLWNHIDQDGFGYVSVLSNECFRCPTIIKVPIIKTVGTITGNTSLCQKVQGKYSLPKWPTTEYNWTINNNVTGATLIQNGQRNEIIVFSQDVGIIHLNCTYFNTLLGCGGTAQFIINVKPTISIVGESAVCSNTDSLYTLTDANGSEISSINTVITGPDNFEQVFTSSPFSITFPSVGVYNLSVPSSDYCSGFFNINVIQKPTPPIAITGPTVICPGIPIVYSCTPSPGLETQWQVSNGTILGSSIGNQVNIVFNPNVAGPYEVNVWYKNDTCSSAIYSIAADRAPIDLSLIQTQNPVCGSSFATYAIADANADSYLWTIIPESAGSIQTGQNTNEISILWNQSAGEARIKIEVVKCKTTTVIQHLINVVNSPISAITASSSTCTNQDTIFTLSLNPSSTFDYVVWNFGDGTTQNVNYNNQDSFSVSHQFLEPLTSSTSYQVTATVYGALGCLMSSIASFTIQVSPSPVIFLAPTNDLALCDLSNIPTSYIYTVNIQNGFAQTNLIQWYRNNNIISGATSASINVQNYGVGSYYAQVTNIFNCSANTKTFTVNNDCVCIAPYQLDFNVINSQCNGFEATTTLVEGTPLNFNWSSVNFPGASITNNTPYNLAAENVQPGKYMLKLSASYIVNDSICYKTKQIPLIIPYKAGLKYNVTCSNGNYNVQLLDYSVFYPETPIQHFAFTLDDGLNWYPATISNGIPQYNTVLPPGSYPIGIRIDRSGYPECKYFETLVLPAMPNATFTATTNNCQDNAVQFTATDTNPDLLYNWNFGDGSFNLQQNPVKVFAGFGDFPVQLTVTNKYGCSATSTQFVNVIPVNMKGDLVQTPLSACQGTTATLHFEPILLPIQETPVSITWYYKNIQSSPIATTVAPNLDLVVNQSGYYIAHLTDANGCQYQFNQAIAVGFIPVPAPPKISGTTIVCLGNAIIVKVPEDSSITYLWTINGETQPQFNGLSTIVLTSTAVGNYSIGVVAQAGSIVSGYCSSSMATMVVAVVDGPTQPELALEVISCQPYLVQVAVANPQDGVNYYWSNGQSGSSTTISHDGPLQVRADINGCSSSSQIDLPLNLESLAWVFPTGCFENCLQNPLGYIIGPLGNFTNWSWLQNGTVVASGTNTIQPFSNVVPTNDYQLVLQNDYCELLIENLNIKEVRCVKCNVEYEIMDIRCVKVNDVYVYQVIVKTLNPYNTTLYMNFTDTTGHGYFSSNTLAIPEGTTIQIMNFYPLSSFNGGLLAIEISGDLNAQTRCFKAINLQFPICQETQPRFYNDSKINTSSLLVAPNPANSSTTVFYTYYESNVNSNKYIEVLDVLGRKMAAFTVVENKDELVIDTSSYAAGSYIILMKLNDEVIDKVKLIINKL